MKLAQDIIDNIEKSVVKTKKINKKDDFSEKKYIKDLIIKEREQKKPIEASSLALKFGTNVELVKEIIDEVNEESKPKVIPKKENKIKNYFKKFKNKERKKILDNDDKNTLKEILIKVIVFGIPINFSLWCFVSHPFSFYSWIAYGYAFWLIKKELVYILRSLWFR